MKTVLVAAALCALASTCLADDGPYGTYYTPANSVHPQFLQFFKTDGTYELHIVFQDTRGFRRDVISGKLTVQGSHLDVGPGHYVSRCSAAAPGEQAGGWSADFNRTQDKLQISQDNISISLAVATKEQVDKILSVQTCSS